MQMSDTTASQMPSSAHPATLLHHPATATAAAIPVLQLLPSVARRVRDPSAVALEIQALEVAALSKVRPGSTKVIVLDSQVCTLMAAGEAVVVAVGNLLKVGNCSQLASPC